MFLIFIKLTSFDFLVFCKKCFYPYKTKLFLFLFLLIRYLTPTSIYGAMLTRDISKKI